MNRIKLGSFAGEQVFMAVEGEAAHDIKESAQHISQHTQHKICPSCGQKLCLGEREECRCWCCEASWASGKLRASA